MISTASRCGGELLGGTWTTLPKYWEFPCYSVRLPWPESAHAHQVFLQYAKSRCDKRRSRSLDVQIKVFPGESVLGTCFARQQEATPAPRSPRDDVR
jgi:hypothetical protein